MGFLFMASLLIGVVYYGIYMAITAIVSTSIARTPYASQDLRMIIILILSVIYWFVIRSIDTDNERMGKLRLITNLVITPPYILMLFYVMGGHDTPHNDSIVEIMLYLFIIIGACLIISGILHVLDDGKFTAKNIFAVIAFTIGFVAFTVLSNAPLDNFPSLNSPQILIYACIGVVATLVVTIMGANLPDLLEDRKLMEELLGLIGGFALMGVIYLIVTHIWFVLFSTAVSLFILYHIGASSSYSASGTAAINEAYFKERELEREREQARIEREWEKERRGREQEREKREKQEREEKRTKKESELEKERQEQERELEREREKQERKRRERERERKEREKGERWGKIHREYFSGKVDRVGEDIVHRDFWGKVDRVGEDIVHHDFLGKEWVGDQIVLRDSSGKIEYIGTRRIYHDPGLD